MIQERIMKKARLQWKNGGFVHNQAHSKIDWQWVCRQWQNVLSFMTDIKTGYDYSNNNQHTQLHALF